MATSDKHCQTFVIKSPELINNNLDNVQVMYDETVNVVNSKEIESPSGSDEDLVAKKAMSKFNPPTRHVARHTFDSGSDSDSDKDDFLDNFTGNAQAAEKSRSSLESKDNLDPRRSAKSSGKKKQEKLTESSDNSDSDSHELVEPPPARGSGKPRGVIIPTEGAYDPKQFQDLKVPADIENIFQYIMKYTPQKIDIEYKLQPFVPEYVPAVGDIDAFIKVTTPVLNVRGAGLTDNVLDFIDNLGLTLLDEPATEQSDSALLHLQLRAISKTTSAKSNVMTKKIDNAEKNAKAIERWIKDVSELHLSKPAPNVTYTVKMPDVDILMEEWPDSMEEVLNDAGFPPATLSCSLTKYVDLVCGLFDIPVVGDRLNDRIHALHLLFTLYSAVKNSQLYADRQKEEKSEVI